MQLVLDPPHGVGPFRIGMPFDDALQALRTIEGFVQPAPTGGYQSPGFAHYESGLSISLGPDRRGGLKAVELYRPDPDVQVLYGDIDVFMRPATEVIRLLSATTEVRVEDDGLWALAPDLLLSLSRDSVPDEDGDEDGLYFTAVLIAAPGYDE